VKLIDLTGSDRRLRVRRVNEESLARYVAAEARKDDTWVVDVRHGGTVANAYGYPAETECALAVASPAGLVIVWLARASANATTERGAAEACLLGAGDLWDGRVKREERKDAAWELIKATFAEEMPVVDQLASLVGAA